jgi:hypothetical protein
MHNYVSSSTSDKSAEAFFTLVHTARAAELGREEKITTVLQITKLWALSQD